MDKGGFMLQYFSFPLFFRIGHIWMWDAKNPSTCKKQESQIWYLNPPLVKTSRKHRPWTGRGLQAIMTGTSETPCLAAGHFRKWTWLLAQETMEQILWWKQFWPFGHSAVFCNILRDGRNLLGNCFLCATSQQGIQHQQLLQNVPWWILE